MRCISPYARLGPRYPRLWLLVRPQVMAAGSLGRPPRRRFRALRARVALGWYVLKRLGPPLFYAVVYLVVAAGIYRWDLGRSGEKVPDVGEAIWTLWALFVFGPNDPLPHAAIARAVFWVTPFAGLFLLVQGVFKIGASLFDLATRREVWTKIMTDQLTGHVIVCGVGHVGYRVIEELCRIGEEVVAIEQDAKDSFVEAIREKGVPVHIGDARRDELLEQLGVKRAKAVVCATSDDLANLEIALDAKRMHPGIRVVMRMFDQRLAAKVGGALELDQSFSTSALAAPLIAVQATHEDVRSAYRIDDEVRVTAEAKVGVSQNEKKILDVEGEIPCRVVSLRRAKQETFKPIRPKDSIHEGDVVIVDVALVDLAVVRSRLGA